MTEMDAGELEIRQELRGIDLLPRGLAQSTAAQDLVRRLEAEGPDSVLPMAYAILVGSLVWNDEAELAFLPFTRQLRLLDARPELFDEQDRRALFWSFRWMVYRVQAFPTITFEQVEEVVADYRRRFALEGLGMDAPMLDEFRWAREREAPDTEERFWAWAHEPREPEDTCLACDAAGEACYLVETGRFELAAARIEKALAQGLSCRTEPCGLLAMLAQCYLELGRPEEAARAFVRSAALLTEDLVPLLDTQGRHLQVLARGGLGAQAVARIVADEEYLFGGDLPLDLLMYHLDVLAALSLVARSEPHMPVSLRRAPASTVSELAAWVLARTQEEGRAFDERNRSGRYARKIAEALAAEAAPEALDPELLGAGQRGPAARAEHPAGELPTDPVPGVALSGRAAFEEAEGVLRSAGSGAARSRYLQAAQLLVPEGELELAGVSEAEAARLADLLGDRPAAEAGYRRALGLLEAGGAAASLRALVARTWAPIAVAEGTAETAAEQLSSLLAELAPAAQDAPAKDRAETLDALARVLASLERHDEALERALAAEEAFEALGSSFDLAHSAWLAGRSLLAADRPAEAVENLERASEVFARLGHRGPRLEALADLVEAHRRSGAPDRAFAVLRELGA